jgi:hypothetical protein
MAQFTREAINLLGREKRLTTGKSDDIFKDKFGKPKFKYAPRYAYFYYIRVNEDGTLKVDHYGYYDIDPDYPEGDYRHWREIPRTKDKLQELVKMLAINARPKQPHKWLLENHSFQDVLWERRAYIIFYFDEKNWTLYKKPNKGSSVVFLTKKGKLKFVKNHSFYDAIDLEIEFSKDDVRSAIAFINYIKGDEDGNDLGYDLPKGKKAKQEFQFNMLLNVKFDKKGGPSPMDIIIDPGGTNQGPPLEP